MSETGSAAFSGEEILTRACAIAPILREEAEKNEANRRLTNRAVEALRSTGVFAMPMPRAWGGPEVDIRTQTQIIEELSAADGAAGWCAMIGSDGGYYTAGLEDSAARKLYPDLDMITAGWIVPAGKLQRTTGGYLLTGRWQFGSGCTHADIIIGGGIVMDDGSPVKSREGQMEIRIAMLPATEFEIIDTWQTTGLAGSGSHDYAIKRVFVPANQTFEFADLAKSSRTGALYAWPGMFFANLPGVPLGIARAALDEAEKLVRDKILVPEMRPAREDPRIRTGIAQAHAMVGAARSHMYDTLGELWTVLEAGSQPSLQLRAALAGAYMYAIRTSRDAVAILADVVGSASIYRKCPIERYMRDLTTISQHLMGQPRIMDIAGALWLGDEEAARKHPLSAGRLI